MTVPYGFCECGRKKDAGPNARGTLQVCLWCFYVNLLAGGFEAPRLEERFSPEEQEQIRVEADRLAVERGADWRVRRQIRQRRETERTQVTIL